jgi:hypothetical protein
MGSFEAAGSIWILVSGFAIALTVAFRGDATAWLATNVTGVVAAMIGAFIIWRPSRRVARASISWGVAWLILYGALASSRSTTSRPGSRISSWVRSAVSPHS